MVIRVVIFLAISCSLTVFEVSFTSLLLRLEIFFLQKNIWIFVEIITYPIEIDVVKNSAFSCVFMSHALYECTSAHPDWLQVAQSPLEGFSSEISWIEETRNPRWKGVVVYKNKMTKIL